MFNKIKKPQGWGNWRVMLVLSLSFFALCAWLADYAMDLTDSANARNFVIVDLLALGLVLMCSDARYGLQRLVLLGSTTALTMGIGEIILREVVAEDVAPLSNRCFVNRVQSTWPMPVKEPKEPGVFRILCLGDSYGQMGGISNFHYLLGNLAKDEGWRVEIVNLSVCGYQVDMERDVLLRYGKRYHPDLVLHNFFAGNDYEFDVRKIFYIYDLPFEHLSDRCYWWPHNFVLPSIVKHLWVLNRESRRAKAEAVRDNQPVANLSEATYLEMENRRLKVADKCRPLIGNGPRVLQILEATRREAVRLGARYLLVVHPDEFQVNTALREALQKNYSLDLDRFDLKAPQRFLRDYAAGAGVPMLDMLEEQGADQLQASSYLLRDSHYNLEGNQKTARTLWRFLKTNALLPGPARADRTK